MNFNKKILILLVAVGLLVISLKYFPYHCNSITCQAKSTNNLKMGTVKLGNETIKVEIVDTNALREQGLSGRKSLDNGSGMLFVFDVIDKYGFWMKDMNFPIDIIWLDENKVVWIEKSVSPTTYPKVFYPKNKAKFVLEVPSGHSDSNGLKVGDSFSVSS